MNKFGISQPVRRSEDSPFLRGHGKYVSDIKLEGSLTAYILRSPHAHAKILSIDVSLAKSQQGVHLILTGEDYQKAGLGAMPMLTHLRRIGIPTAFSNLNSMVWQLI